MNEFDIVFDQLQHQVLDETDNARVTLVPTATELDEIDALRQIAADVNHSEPSTYAAVREQSADITVHFRHVVE